MGVVTALLDNHVTTHILITNPVAEDLLLQNHITTQCKYVTLIYAFV